MSTAMPELDEQLDLSTIIDPFTNEEVQDSDGGDQERFSHYVKKDAIVDSAVNGSKVVALCGKVWTPRRNPQAFPICPACKDIYDGINPGDDSSDSSDD